MKMNNQPPKTIDTKTAYAMGILTIILLGLNLFLGVFIWYLVRSWPMPIVPFGLLFMPITVGWWKFWSKVPL
jgi:hypothetical protein